MRHNELPLCRWNGPLHKMKLIKKLFNSPQPGQADVDLPSQPIVHEDSRLGGEGSQTATRRELVRVLARDVMRHNGIPEGWIDCHVMVVSTRAGQVHIYPRLTFKKWDERLLRYAMAFERRLMGEVERFEPQAAEWLLAMTWQFDVPDCPYPELPPREVWVDAPDAVMDLLGADPPDTQPAMADDSKPVPLPLLDEPPAPTAEDELQEDLARLFAVRESELANLRSDFSSLEPGPR